MITRTPATRAIAALLTVLLTTPAWAQETSSPASDAFVVFRVERGNRGSIYTSILLATVQPDGRVNIRERKSSQLPRPEMSNFLGVKDGQLFFQDTFNHPAAIVDVATGTSRQAAATAPAIVYWLAAPQPALNSRGVKFQWDQLARDAFDQGMQLKLIQPPDATPKILWDRVYFQSLRNEISDREPPAAWLDDRFLIVEHTLGIATATIDQRSSLDERLAGISSLLDPKPTERSEELVLIDVQAGTRTRLGQIPPGRLEFLVPPAGQGDAAVVLNENAHLSNTFQSSALYGISLNDAHAGHVKLKQGPIHWGPATSSGSFTLSGRLKRSGPAPGQVAVENLSFGNLPLAHNANLLFSPDGTRVLWTEIPNRPFATQTLRYFDAHDQKIHDLAANSQFVLGTWTYRKELQTPTH